MAAYDVGGVIAPFVRAPEGAGRPLLGARAVRLGAPAEPAPLAFFLLLFFLGLLFASLPLVWPAAARFTPAHLIAAGALAAAFLERTAARRPFLLVWPDTQLLFGFAAVSALSCIFALWPGYAVDNMLMLLRYVAIYLLIVNTATSVLRLKVLYGVFAFGGLVPALGALWYQHTGRLVEGRLGWVGIFSNPNDLAYTLDVLLPLALALALVTRSLLLKAALGATLAVYALTIFLSYSRGGLFGFAAVVLLALLRFGRPALLVPAGLVAAAALAAGPTVEWHRQQGFGDLTHDATVQQRMGTITAGLRMFEDRPLLGVGPGCSEVGWKEYAPDASLANGTLHTHNTFVQALAETGLLGAALFFLLLWNGLRKATRAARFWKLRGARVEQRLGTALEISLCGLFVCGISGGYVLSWFPYLLLGLVGAAWNLTVAASHAAVPAVESRGEAPCAASPAF
jgi:O-antigen ligase